MMYRFIRHRVPHHVIADARIKHSLATTAIALTPLPRYKDIIVYCVVIGHCAEYRLIMSALYEFW